MLTAQHFNCFFVAVFMVSIGLVLVGCGDNPGAGHDVLSITEEPTPVPPTPEATPALQGVLEADVLEAFKKKVNNDTVFEKALNTLNELNDLTNPSLRAVAPKKHAFSYVVFEHPNADFWLLKNIYENEVLHRDASANFIPFFMESDNGWRWTELFQDGDKAVIKAFKAKRTTLDDDTIKMELDHLASANDHKAQIVFGRTYTFAFIESMIYLDDSGKQDVGITVPALEKYLAWASGHNQITVSKAGRVDTHAAAKKELESYLGVKLPVPKQHFETPP